MEQTLIWTVDTIWGDNTMHPASRYLWHSRLGMSMSSSHHSVLEMSAEAAHESLHEED